MNRLLERQLRRYYGSTENVPPELENFIKVIDRTYEHHDEDRKLTERSLEISSEELVAANTEMRGIFNLFPDIFFRLDSTGLILDYSTGSYNNLFENETDLTGKYIQNIPQENVSASFKAAIELTNGSHKRETFEYSLEVNNEKRYFESSLIPVFENQIIVFIKDITKRKLTEQELKIAKERAEQSDKLKSAFLANMSHEIRTPMNSILGFTEFLDSEEISSEDKKHFVEIIRSSGNHLLSLINDIIDISKIEAGQLTIHTEDCKVNEIMSEVNELFLTKDKVRTGKIKISYVNSLPKTDSIIVTDSIRLKQILINLIGNSLKFTIKGEISFGYDIVAEDNKPMMQFFVKDTGIGILEESSNLIFDRFSQEHNPNTLAEGTGLGLSISKELINILGGKIWFKSQIGKGTEFYFTIPYNPPQRLHLKKSETKDFKIKSHDFTDKNILIAEDQRNNTLFIEVLLRTKKAKVLFASNGQEAVEFCKHNKNIDIVLMDIKMPVMDGLQATKIIKADRPNLPIIAVTALAMSTDRNNAFNAGCDDFITKPVDTTTLLECIATHL